MKLTKLMVQGYGPFKKPTEVSFPDRGMVLLRGSNLSTGGGSGAGKSALMSAISYALGYCPTPATKLQNWTDGAPDMRVSLSMVGEDGAEVEVRREQGKLRVSVGGEVSDRVRPAEERLAKALRLPQSVLGVLAYRPQGEPGAFLSMSDEDKKSFLSSVLGLDDLERAAQTAEDRAKTVSNELPPLKEALDRAIGTAAAYPRPIPEERDLRVSELARLSLISAKKAVEVLELKKTLSNVTQAAQERLGEALKRATDSEGEIRSRLTQLAPEVVTQAISPELVECRTRLAAAVKADQERQRAYQESRGKAIKAAVTAEAARASIPRYKTELEALRLKEAALATNLCPTCLRGWPEEHATQLALVRHEIQAADLALEQLKAVYAPTVEEWDAANPWMPSQTVETLRGLETVLANKHLEDTYQARASREHEIALLKTRLVEIEQAKTTAHLEAQSDQRVIAAQAALDSAESSEGAIWMAIQTAQQAIKALDKMADAYAITALAEASARATYEDKKTEAVAEADFAELVGRKGFLGAIFDEVLLEISDDVNRVLATVANVRHLSVGFRSETVSKKGEARRSISMTVSVGGQELVGAEVKYGISGGQLSAVRLAVDLALLSVIERRTGVRTGWIVLDEAFDGLGVVEKETCMEVLREISADHLVLVVDHSSEMGELFSKEIVVEHRDGESWVA